MPQRTRGQICKFSDSAVHVLVPHKPRVRGWIFRILSPPQTFSQTTTAADLSHDGSFPFTINVNEAEELIRLLPAIKELHTKGIEVKWESEPVPAKNNGDYHFFRIYVTAQRTGDKGSISIGNYAVSKHTADGTVNARLGILMNLT